MLSSDLLWFHINCFQVEAFTHTHRCMNAHTLARTLTHSQEPHTYTCDGGNHCATSHGLWAWTCHPQSPKQASDGSISALPDLINNPNWCDLIIFLVLKDFMVFFFPSNVFFLLNDWCLYWNVWSGPTLVAQQTQWPLTPPPRGHDAVWPTAVLHPGRLPGCVWPHHHRHVHQGEGGPTRTPSLTRSRRLFLIISPFCSFS